MTLCASCNKDLAEDNFSPGLLKLSPGHWICRPCNNAKLEAYQAANRDKIREYNRKYEAENRDKRNAKREVLRAVQHGRIEKTGCVICGETGDVEGHHFSYDRKDWLSVIWVCPVHHKAIHSGAISIDDLPITHGRFSRPIV